MEKLTKQRAIKWIVELEKAKDEPGYRVMFAVDYKITDPKSVINWIKYFFSITEKDLEVFKRHD